MKISVTTEYHSDGSFVQFEIKFDDSNNWIETRNKYFNVYKECCHIKDYNSKGIFYEEWRTYHQNGNLKGLYNTQGFRQEFDERGLPIL